MINQDFNRASLLESAYELVEAGIPIIQLHPMNDDLECTCTDPKCTKLHPETGEKKSLAGKHPMVKAWQKTPVPDTEARIEEFCYNLENYTPQNTTGLGAVLPDDIVIVDVDCKNGKKGALSLNKLEHHIGQKLNDICGYKVVSGSGAPSAHYWFRKPADLDIRKTLKDYPDIDFLHQGNYVVIEGSCHQSGGLYEKEKADQSINKITSAPQKLLDVIERKQKMLNTDFQAEAGSCDMQEITEALDWILQDNQGSVPYEEWFKICMALHYETGGSQEGYELFDAWSAKGSNYGGTTDTYAKWCEGFKPSDSKASGATILYMAQELGWERNYGIEVDLGAFIDSLNQSPKEKIVSKDGVELELGEIPKEMREFYGSAGHLLNWSLENSKKPSFQISLAAMLHTLSVVLGRDFKTDTDSYASIYQMVVAKTGRGKEQPMKVFSRCAKMLTDKYPQEKSTLMTDATSVGAMVSELEVSPRKGVVLDEIGHILEAISKVKSDRNSLELSSFYLQVFGRCGETYTPKSMSRRGLSKEDREKAAEQKEMIERPAVSIIGMTTPVKFMDILSREMMQDGFINRFLMWFPQEGRQPIRLTETQPIPEAFWHWVERIYIRLLSVNGGDPSTIDRNDPINPLREVVVKVRDTEAEKVWRDFEQECWRSAEAVEEIGFDEVYERSPEIVMRLALILQLAKAPESGEIEADVMRQACAMVRFSKSEEIKCYKLEFAENAVEKREKLIYNEILDKEFSGICLADLFASRACSGLKPKESKEFIQSLLDKQMIIMEDTNTAKGRPSYKKQYVYSTKFKEIVEEDENV